VHAGRLAQRRAHDRVVRGAQVRRALGHGRRVVFPPPPSARPVSDAGRAPPGFVAAKLCPHLIFVSNDFARYSEMSRRVMAVFRQYDPNMLVAGCDEGYLKFVRATPRRAAT
jgi:nucleotidyltransferase/DNA polymerase involved in DNA repair